MTSSSSDVLKNTQPSKDLAWWVPNIDHKITPEVRLAIFCTYEISQSMCSSSVLQVRQVLETYSNIAPDDVVDHVYAIVSTNTTRTYRRHCYAHQ